MSFVQDEMHTLLNAEGPIQEYLRDAAKKFTLDDWKKVHLSGSSVEGAMMARLFQVTSTWPSTNSATSLV